ncbi:MAG: hypothetical protein Q9220_002758 [cf. Caloplaca sp. 1 TL-2023]
MACHMTREQPRDTDWLSSPDKPWKIRTTSKEALLKLERPAISANEVIASTHIIIDKCRRQLDDNIHPGFFVDMTVGQLQMIVISQGTTITWPFLIRFAGRMRDMASRAGGGGLSTYDAYYSTAPGDVMVSIALRVVGESMIHLADQSPTS